MRLRQNLSAGQWSPRRGSRGNQSRPGRQHNTGRARPSGRNQRPVVVVGGGQDLAVANHDPDLGEVCGFVCSRARSIRIACERVVDDNVPGVSFVAGDTIVLKREITVNGSPFFLPVDEVVRFVLHPGFLIVAIIHPRTASREILLLINVSENCGRALCLRLCPRPFLAVSVVCCMFRPILI